MGRTRGPSSRHSLVPCPDPCSSKTGGVGFVFVRSLKPPNQLSGSGPISEWRPRPLIAGMRACSGTLVSKLDVSYGEWNLCRSSVERARRGPAVTSRDLGRSSPSSFGISLPTGLLLSTRSTNKGRRAVEPLPRQRRMNYVKSCDV